MESSAARCHAINRRDQNESPQTLRAVRWRLGRAALGAAFRGHSLFPLGRGMLRPTQLQNITKDFLAPGPRLDYYARKWVNGPTETRIRSTPKNTNQNII